MLKTQYKNGSKLPEITQFISDGDKFVSDGDKFRI